MGKQACNHNVVVTFIRRISDGVAQGIWNYSALTAYIYLSEGKQNKLVGFAQGVFGLFLAVSGVCGGYIADRSRRDTVLKFAGVVALAAIGCTLAAVLFPPFQDTLLATLHVDSRYALLCVALSLWGVAEGNDSVVDAIFADSIPTGARSKIMTTLYSAYLAACSIGPALAAVLFALTGNQWELPTLRLVILVGMAVALVPAVSFFFFNDDKTLGHESEAVGYRQTLLQDAGEDCECQRQLLEAEQQAEYEARSKRRFWCLSSKAVPYIFASSDTVFGLASGMTVMYFTIFFKEEVHLTPAATTVIQCFSILLISVISLSLQSISRFTGRVQAILLTKAVGVSLLFWMGANPGMWTREAIIIPVCVLRTGANNAAYPLSKSILMDFVRKESRGKWNAFETVVGFGWSGSAVLGGLLIDKYGFQATFTITAWMQFAAWVILWLLLPLVPRYEEQLQLMPRPETPTAVAAAAAAATAVDALSAPLGHAEILSHAADLPPSDRTCSEQDLGSHQCMRAEELLK